MIAMQLYSYHYLRMEIIAMNYRWYIRHHSACTLDTTNVDISSV